MLKILYTIFNVIMLFVVGGDIKTNESNIQITNRVFDFVESVRSKFNEEKPNELVQEEVQFQESSTQNVEKNDLSKEETSKKDPVVQENKIPVTEQSKIIVSQEQNKISNSSNEAQNHEVINNQLIVESSPENFNENDKQLLVNNEQEVDNKENLDDVNKVSIKIEDEVVSNYSTEKLYPSTDACNNAGIELQIKYLKNDDIINTFCFSVAENGKLKGYRLDINCKSGNCDKYKN